MIDRFDRVIELSGELNDDQRQQLLAIAEKCPVHRTLLNDKQIVTTIAGTDRPRPRTERS